MPSVSERQRRYMAMCAHTPGHKKGCPTNMSKSKMREFSYTSHLPSGVSQSPKGDLEAAADKELAAAFPRRIKNSGATLGSKRRLPYHPESMQGDSPGLSVRHAPKDEVS